MITADQLRAARRLLNWEQSDLADRIGVSVPMIEVMETSGPVARSGGEKLGNARRVLEAAGVEFTIGDAASLRIKPVLRGLDAGPTAADRRLIPDRAGGPAGNGQPVGRPLVATDQKNAVAARVVRSREGIPPGESFLEFAIYRSPEDGLARGYLSFGHQSPALQAAAYASFALSLQEAWAMALAFVREHRIHVLWVNDPESLLALGDGEIAAGTGQPGQVQGCCV